MIDRKVKPAKPMKKKKLPQSKPKKQKLFRWGKKGR